MRGFLPASEAKLSKDKIIHFPSFAIHKVHFSVNLASSFCSYSLIRKSADPCVEWSWTLNNLDDFFFFFGEGNILILSCTAAYRVSIMGSCLREILGLSTLRIFLHKCRFLVLSSLVVRKFIRCV